jgi:hypothetical protein
MTALDRTFGFEGPVNSLSIHASHASRKFSSSSIKTPSWGMITKRKRKFCYCTHRTNPGYGLDIWAHQSSAADMSFHIRLLGTTLVAPADKQCISWAHCTLLLASRSNGWLTIHDPIPVSRIRPLTGYSQLAQFHGGPHQLGGSVAGALTS